MAVPLLELTAQNLAFERELREAFDRILRSGQYINGPDVAEFEKEVARYLDVKHAIGVSSGTDAILLALMALGIGPGDEVLCPSFTFFATAGCVARVGATPVFIDSDLATFNIDSRDAARKITSHTKAIIPVHLFGQSADMDAVRALAVEHNLHVIEDAAQSFGAQFKGRATGTMGAFGTYSFFPSKNLGTLGDAGLLVSNDDKLAEKAVILRNHGAKPKYYHKYIGGNFRLDTLHAAFLRIKLPKLATYNRRRKANAAHYSRLLQKSAGNSEAYPASLILPREAPGVEHIWNQYTVRLPQPAARDRAREYLQAKGIGTEIYYPVPLHLQECFQSFPSGTVTDSCPRATRLAREVLSLPVYPELEPGQLEIVARELLASFTVGVDPASERAS